MLLPNSGMLKLNRDGCSHGNPGKGSIGVVIREWNSVFRRGVMGLGHVTNFEAECMGFFFVMKYVSKKGWAKIWIETDSQTAKMAISSDNVPWRMKSKSRLAVRAQRHKQLDN